MACIPIQYTCSVTCLERAERIPLLNTVRWLQVSTAKRGILAEAVPVPVRQITADCNAPLDAKPPRGHDIKAARTADNDATLQDIALKLQAAVGEQESLRRELKEVQVTSWRLEQRVNTTSDDQQTESELSSACHSLTMSRDSVHIVLRQDQARPTSYIKPSRT